MNIQSNQHRFNIGKMKIYTQETISFYDGNIETYVTSGSVVILKDRLKLFTDLLAGDNILDIACGPGHDTDYLIKKGFNCTGIDLSEEMIKYAKRNHKGNFAIMDFFNLEFKDCSYDGLWCSSVFGHIKTIDIFVAIKEFSRILMKNGIIGIIAVKKQNIVRNNNDTRTYTMYEDNQLEKYLEQECFEIISSEEFNFGNRTRLFILARKTT